MVDSLKYWLIVYASTLASRIISLKETPKDELQDEVFNQIYVDTFIKKIKSFNGCIWQKDNLPYGIRYIQKAMNY